MKNPLSTWLSEVKRLRAQRKLVDAVNLVSQYGFALYKQEVVGKTTYIIDANGVRHRIGKGKV